MLFRSAVASAKFNCQLTCSSQFETYEGVWASCKQDQILFKNDLRFLLTLLAEGKLEPQVEERVCLEDVPGECLLAVLIDSTCRVH